MTEEKKSMVPKLRFPEFTETWEQRELKDVAEIVGGGTPSTSVPAYWNGSIDWYSPTEIGQENFATRGLTIALQNYFLHIKLYFLRAERQ